MERDTQYYIEKGFIDVNDNAEFRTIAEAASCFGKKYIASRRSYFRHPKEREKRLWFPKLYDNKDWENTISSDESVIISKSKFPEKGKEEIDSIKPDEDYIVVTFTRDRNSEGKMMYLFRGVYELDKDAMSYEKGQVWKKIADRIKTYPTL
ncbi:MAG: hypothetical protein LUM44_11740 [Pyrinomonadaceae bacterium]|nr:hypothetical protein [Pyrinomonadaceae bacterium]